MALQKMVIWQQFSDPAMNVQNVPVIHNLIREQVEAICKVFIFVG